jgi:hypothetical protein
MDLSKGAKSVWVKEKQSLPTGRVMGETTITPDGKVLILNGAKTGLAGCVLSCRPSYRLTRSAATPTSTTRSALPTPTIRRTKASSTIP